MFGTHKVTLSEPYLLIEPDASPEIIEETQDEANWIAEFLTSEEEDPMEPISDYYYPIIDTGIDRLNLQGDEDGYYNKDEGNVVALLSISVYWRDAIKNILPDGSQGLVAVFENECAPSFTYQIDGARVDFLGGGDLHDPQYTHLGMASWLHDLKEYAIDDSSYSGRPMNEEYCPFFVTIYPSNEMKSQFTSNLPIYSTIAAILIFAFTSAIFVLYDCYVERRHRVVEKTAVQNKAVVESLFPAFVRKEVEDVVTHDKQSNGNEQSINRLSAFLNDGSERQPGSPTNTGVGKSKPIADLFDHTTVMFGMSRRVLGEVNWMNKLNSPLD